MISLFVLSVPINKASSTDASDVDESYYCVMTLEIGEEHSGQLTYSNLSLN